MKEFFSYFLAQNVSPTFQNKSNFVGSFIKVYLFVVCYMLIFGFSGFMTMGVLGFGLLMFAMISVIMGMLHTEKPSLLTIIPLNYKKRTAFYFLSCILMNVLVILMVCAFYLIGIAIGLSIVAITEGINFAEFFTDIPIQTVNLSAWAIVYLIFSYIFHFSVVTSISRIQKKRYMALAMLVYFLVTFFGSAALIGTLVNANSAIFAAEYDLGIFGLLEEFEYLQYPWLPAVLCALIAILTVFGSVMFILKKEKPKNF